MTQMNGEGKESAAADGKPEVRLIRTTCDARGVCVVNDFIDQHFFLLFALACLWAVGVSIVSYLWQRKHSPICPADILYEEKWRYGISYRNIIPMFEQRFRIIFLKDRLVLRPHYPFAPFAGLLGFNREIPYSSIASAAVMRVLFGRRLVLEFQSDKGREKMVLWAYDPDRMLTILKENSYAASFPESL